MWSDESVTVQAISGVIPQFAGKTVGGIGAGGIGTAALRLLAPLGVRGLALTRSDRDVPGAAESVSPDGPTICSRFGDFLLLAAPGTPETNGLLSADRLALLPSQAWIVNVGRGSIVDTEPLVAAIETGRLAGAVLDITDSEPLPDAHPLWRLTNAIVTSHTACTRALVRAGVRLAAAEIYT